MILALAVHCLVTLVVRTSHCGRNKLEKEGFWRQFRLKLVIFAMAYMPIVLGANGAEEVNRTHPLEGFGDTRRLGHLWLERNQRNLIPMDGDKDNFSP